MSEAWVRFYRGRLLSESYRDYVRGRYAPFISLVVDSVRPGDRVYEVGCGIGTITSLLTDILKSKECKFRCYDLSPDMVELTRINLHHAVRVEKADAITPTGFLPDIVHSHGLLEHLSDEMIRQVIEAERVDGTRVAVHYVPGEKYKSPSFGDERLLSVAAWKYIANPTEIVTFNDGYDYALKWVF